jgi:hypothetical protein
MGILRTLHKESHCTDVCPAHADPPSSPGTFVSLFSGIYLHGSRLLCRYASTFTNRHKNPRYVRSSPTNLNHNHKILPLTPRPLQKNRQLNHGSTSNHNPLPAPTPKNIFNTKPQRNLSTPLAIPNTTPLTPTPTHPAYYNRLDNYTLQKHGPTITVIWTVA